MNTDVKIIGRVHGYNIVFVSVNLSRSRNVRVSVGNSNIKVENAYHTMVIARQILFIINPSDKLCQILVSS